MSLWVVNIHGEIEGDYDIVGEYEPTKTGKWVKYASPRCGEQHYRCTNCDDYVNFGQYGDYYTKDFKFCPHCGTRMEGEEECR